MPTCSSGTVTNVLPQCMECHVVDTGHDTPSRHSIHTQGQPDVVQPIDVERHTADWNTQLSILMSWVRPDREIIADPPHTLANAQLYDAGMVVVSKKVGRKRTCGL